MTDKLTDIDLDPKHKIFADHYLTCGKISESARLAGYAVSGAHVSGNRLLKRPDVQAYLAVRRDEVLGEQKDLQTRITEELEKLAFANISKFISIDKDGLPQVDFSNATEEELVALTSVQTKKRKIYDNKGQHIATEDHARFVMADKYRGLELLGKHLGMFKEADQRIVVDVADRLLAARQRVMSLGQGGDADL